MEINITGRNLNVTQAMKDYAKDKLLRMLSKHTPERVTNVHIILDVEKFRHTVEVELHRGDANIYGKVTTRDMYLSIDKAVDKMERQIVRHDRRYKSKRQKERRRWELLRRLFPSL